MTQAAERRHMSAREYLVAERAAEGKHEYLAGEVFAMAGASARHNGIVANLVALLGQALRDGPCRVFPSDLKIHVPASDLFTYPDVSIVCGDLAFYEGTTDVVTNPKVLVEVLSASTERYDRGEKAEAYRAIPSVVEHLLVAQGKPRIEHYSRQSDGSWIFREAHVAGSITLSSVGALLPVDEVYRRVFELPE
jgi:Uma2 family endonuclease